MAGNLGESIDANTIRALGTQSTGLSTGQLMMINPQDIQDNIDILGASSDWNQGQLAAIIQSLELSGMQVPVLCPSSCSLYLNYQVW